MTSALARLAPLVLTLRGSKRMFSSAERTLARVEHYRRHPVSADPPASLSRRNTVTRTSHDGWPVWEIGPRDAPVGSTAVYLHGGCYVFEIDSIQWTFAGRLANEAGIRILVPIMPLPPVAVASTVVQTAADLLESTIGRFGAGLVSIIGDSSGGGMALAVAMEARDRGLPPLRATVLSAPWLDISGTDPMLAEIAPRDPWLAVAGTHAAGALYRGELAEDDWRVSPIHGSLDGLGPVTMFCGTRDILYADAARFVALAAAAGLPVDFHIGEGMVHNYPALPMPEGDAARRTIAAALNA